MYFHDSKVVCQICAPIFFFILNLFHKACPNYLWSKTILRWLTLVYVHINKQFYIYYGGSKVTHTLLNTMSNGLLVQICAWYDQQCCSFGQLYKTNNRIILFKITFLTVTNSHIGIVPNKCIFLYNYVFCSLSLWCLGGMWEYVAWNLLALGSRRCILLAILSDQSLPCGSQYISLSVSLLMISQRHWSQL